MDTQPSNWPIKKRQRSVHRWMFNDIIRKPIITHNYCNFVLRKLKINFRRFCNRMVVEILQVFC